MRAHRASCRGGNIAESLARLYLSLAPYPPWHPSRYNLQLINRICSMKPSERHPPTHRWVSRQARLSHHSVGNSRDSRHDLSTSSLGLSICLSYRSLNPWKLSWAKRRGSSAKARDQTNLQHRHPKKYSAVLSNKFVKHSMNAP